MGDMGGNGSEDWDWSGLGGWMGEGDAGDIVGRVVRIGGV